MKIKTAYKEIASANIIGVTVGSNCPQGGDSGQGGRTYLSIEDFASTDMRVIVDGREFDYATKLELVFGGDTEHDTLIEALEFALGYLRTRMAFQEGPEIAVD